MLYVYAACILRVCCVYVARMLRECCIYTACMLRVCCVAWCVYVACMPYNINATSMRHIRTHARNIPARTHGRTDARTHAIAFGPGRISRNTRLTADQKPVVCRACVSCVCAFIVCGMCRDTCRDVCRCMCRDVCQQRPACLRASAPARVPACTLACVPTHVCLCTGLHVWHSRPARRQRYSSHIFFGLYGHGLYSYGIYNYGLYSYGRSWRARRQRYSSYGDRHELPDR